MSFIEGIKEKAKGDIKKIVLPEATDLRILEATQTVLREGYAQIVLIGNEEVILGKARENNIDISGATIINPEIIDIPNPSIIASAALAKISILHLFLCTPYYTINTILITLP